MQDLSVLKPGKAWANWDELVILFPTNMVSCQLPKKRFHSEPVVKVARATVLSSSLDGAQNQSGSELGSSAAKPLGAQSPAEPERLVAALCLGLPR